MTKQNLLQGDCMDLMRSKPDKFYDLAIVDPPYGIGEDGNKTKSRTFRKDGTHRLSVDKRTGRKSFIYNEYKDGNWDDKFPDQQYFDELFRVSKNQIIWGENYILFDQKQMSSGRIFWDKINGSNDFSDGEMAWTSIFKSIRKFEFMWSGMLQGIDMIEGRTNNGNKKLCQKRIHPTEKPIALYKWLLTNYAKQGQTIIDTHGGSFSHAIAAYDLGFDLDIIELDPDYYRDGKARFDNHVTKCEEIKSLGYAKTAIQKVNPTLF